ncbi:MAG TPA: protein kinase [Polyangiaceae bacterium]|nr:protein kinase [Polyangiaceae bacterium]
MDGTTPSEEARSLPFRVAERYEVTELLGRGGMASVYRARDDATGAAVALKLLTADADAKRTVRGVELFEREFHTLVHLAHPRIVRAHEYGFHGEQPYYSMELLDGGDLRELSPLPWQEVCTVAYEICSALSLLHSRRLVHRDLTPRNIRKTSSGQTKLIDFGLLSPMGETTLLAGTPPFVAPELITTMALDGRSDLFSLGATLYYALTRRQPYSARAFDQLQDAWRSTPARPSRLAPGVPAALDDILLGMLRIDAGSRPKSAAEVMERLLPLLPARPDDELRAARAYLSTPKLIGREQVVSQFRKQMLRAVRGRGGGFAVVGEDGSGRSRMLDAFVLEAQLVGATAVRSGYADAGQSFGVAASIAAQIHRAAPAVALTAALANAKSAALLYPGAPEPADASTAILTDVTRPDLDRAEVQTALRSFILEFANRRTLAIAIDDLDRIDEPSAALIASLTWEAAGRRLVYAGALSDRRPDSTDAAVSILLEHAERIALQPLGGEEVKALLASSFGDVPNLAGLAAKIAMLSGGRPRECMAFAQCLVDEGVIAYAGGSWTLPAELPDGILPASLEDVFSRRIAQLGPVARRIAALLAENLVERLGRTDLRAIELASLRELDAALDELLASRIVSGDATGYALRGSGVARILSTSLNEAEKRRVHDDLCELHARAGRHLLLCVYHACSGSDPGKWLDRLAAETTTSDARTLLSFSSQSELGTARVARALDRARATAERIGRPERELQSIWVLLAGACAQGGDPAHFHLLRDRWLANLKRDTGYDDWQRLDPSLDPNTRVMTAIGMAVQRYAATPEPSRVLPPLEAIQQLVAYAVFTISVAGRVQDLELQASLPELLEPFAPLNPLIAAMLTNAHVVRLNGLGKREQARRENLRLLEQLEGVSAEQLRYVEKIRAAVCYSLSSGEALLGIPPVHLTRFASEQDPNHQVSARLLQMIAALQQGDAESAEAHRHTAELLSLQNKASSMFSTLPLELETYAAARDLTRVRQVRAGIHEFASQFPGWAPLRHVADAYYLRLCGDLQGALDAAELAVQSGQRGGLISSWVWTARTIAVELLTDLGRPLDALALGSEALEACRSLDAPYINRNLSRAIAGAETKLGRLTEAAARVEAIIAEQRTLDITGVQLGQSYEARARVAIAQEDKQEFHHSLALAREQYQRGKKSAFRALYERLADEGRQAGLIEETPGAVLGQLDAAPRSTMDLADILDGCATARERAERALALLCDGDTPTSGHLFLYTKDGLTLAASNASCDSVTELTRFAKDCVESESRADTMETGAMTSVPLGTMSGEWRDVGGTCYDTVLLGALMSGTFCIAGVALLVRRGDIATSGALAQTVARALITVGDAISVSAA